MASLIDAGCPVSSGKPPQDYVEQVRGHIEPGGAVIRFDTRILELPARSVQQGRPKRHLQQAPGISLTPHASEMDVRQALTVAGVSGDPLIESALRLLPKIYTDRRDGGASELNEHIFPVLVDAIRNEIKQGRRLNRDEILALMFHDAFEGRAGKTWEEVVLRDFGVHIWKLVWAITKLPKTCFNAENGELNILRQHEVMDRTRRAGKRAVLERAYDRYSNVDSTPMNMTQADFRDYVRRKLGLYIAETEKQIIPVVREAYPDLAVRLEKRIELLLRQVKGVYGDSILRSLLRARLKSGLRIEATKAKSKWCQRQINAARRSFSLSRRLDLQGEAESL